MQQLSPAEEAKRLRRIKVATSLMLVVFAIQLFTNIPELWPISRWQMYARIGPPPADYADYEVRVMTTDGTVHILPSSEVGYKGHEIIFSAFNSRHEDATTTYRTLLTNRVQNALPEAEIAWIEGWYHHWEVNTEEVPPLDPEAPNESTFQGNFPAAFYARTTPADDTVDLLFGENIGLLEFNLIGERPVTQCGRLYAHTGWRALDAPAEDYQITLVLTDETGIGRAQSDGPLANTQTSTWQPQQQYLDRRIIDIPCALPADSYNLLVGLYNLDTLQNLPITYPDGTAYGILAYLTTVEIGEAGSS